MSYPHGHGDAVLRSHRNRTVDNSAAYLRPHLRPGQRVLDIGSGPGTITAELAALVAPGEVVALEINDEAAAATEAELRRRGVETARVIIGDVHDLDLGDDSFDVVHAHQVLQYVADPPAALREMARVCRPGGVVGVRDSDYAAFTWFPGSAGLDRWMTLYQEAARARGGEPDAGRRLLAWARRAGLHDVVATSSTWCYADAASRAWWGGMWAERILDSGLADQLLREGRATSADLAEISQAWRDWAAEEDGWFSILHGELVIAV